MDLNNVLAETELDLVFLEVTIKIFYFKFYSFVCKGQINLQPGKEKKRGIIVSLLVFH